MSILTVRTLAVQLASELGVTEDHTDALNYLSQVEIWINDVVREILNERRWSWRNTSETINTVASTVEYSLQTSAARIKAARIGGGYDVPLELVTIAHLSDLGVDMELTGQPEVFYQSGYDTATQKTKISLWPIPNAVYSIIIYEEIRATDLASGATIPFPEEMYSVLKDGVRYYLYREDGDYQTADRCKQDFEKKLFRLKAKDAVEMAEHPVQEYKDAPYRDQGIVRLSKYPRIF